MAPGSGLQGPPLRLGPHAADVCGLSRLLFSATLQDASLRLFGFLCFPSPSSCESIKIKTRTAPWSAGVPRRRPCARRTAGPSCLAVSSSAPSAETLSCRSRTGEAAEVSGPAAGSSGGHARCLHVLLIFISKR